MSVITLIARLVKFESIVRANKPNQHPKRCGRPQLPVEMRFTQTEFLEAFEAKNSEALSRNVRNALVVVARVNKGKDSWATISEKAGVLIERISDMHDIVPVSAPKRVFIDEPEDFETDAMRLQGLADEVMRRDLIKACEKLQPMCWGLACELDRRDACPMLPRGFKLLGSESLTKLKSDIGRTLATWTADLETRKRLEAEAAAARKLEIVENQRLHAECMAEFKKLADFADSKRVRLARVELPDPLKAKKEAFEVALSAIKRFRPKIEMRARELDPRRSGCRVHNPSALRVQFAA